MDKIDILQLMIKEASDSGIISSYTGIETYTKVWASFERILDIAILNSNNPIKE